MNKQKLIELEKGGNYVFHGSPLELDKLEPKQAYNWDEEKREMVKHGEPCVAATPFAEIAIFRAIINITNAPEEHSTSFGFNGSNQIHFAATQRVLDQAKDKSGYVYVFKKENFSLCSNMECRSNQEQTPHMVFKVTFEDLPQNIEIIEYQKIK